MSQRQTTAVNVRYNDWEPTYRKTYEGGKRLARRRLPVEELNDFEDKVQDAFVRLLERAPDPSEIDDPKNYALKAVQNVCIDRCNCRSRLKAENCVPLDALNNDDNEQPLLELADPGRDPAMNAEINEKNEMLLRELKFHCSDLTKREKDLLALYLQGLSNDQIASAWGEDVKIIRVDMNALLAKVRYRLQHGNGKRKSAS